MSDRLSGVSSQLWNCEDAFSNDCPKRWSELASTDTPRVRFCDTCSRNVTYCTSPEEFVELGNAGECVAVPDEHSAAPLTRLLLGKPSASALKSIRLAQQRAAGWWNEVIGLEPAFSSEALKEIAQLTDRQRLRETVLPKAQREYLARLKDAVDAGPDALYLFARTRPNGKRDNQQNIFRVLRSHFDLTYRDCRDIARRMDSAHPED